MLKRLLVVSIAAAAIRLLLIYTPAAGAPAAPRATAPNRRPDILLVTIDALRADHLGSYGYRRLTSPTIDAFARCAVTLTNTIAQAPYTKASVASLMTGLYPSSHKTVTTSVPFPDAMTGHPAATPVTTDVLPSALTTLAEALHAGGYRTLGFTANPFLIEAFGFGQGFDRFTFFAGQDFLSADHVIAAALDAIRDGEREDPIFVWVHLMEPHSPYTPPAWTAGMVRLSGPAEPIPADVAIPSWLVPGSPRDLRAYVAAYDEEISAADVAFGSLVRGFRDLRDATDAVIVVTADHGEQFLDHGGWEHSTNLYDELIRVPLVIAAPGLTPGVIDTQAQLVDLYPTLLAFAGEDIPENLAGRNLAGVLQRRDGSHPALSEIPGREYAIRDGAWKLIQLNDGSEQLFDLQHDPGEIRNVAAVDTTRAARMRALLDRTLARAVERGRSIAAARAPVDPVVLERLRALGYVHD